MMVIIHGEGSYKSHRRLSWDDDHHCWQRISYLTWSPTLEHLRCEHCDQELELPERLFQITNVGGPLETSRWRLYPSKEALMEDLL